jgi:hypothetical protein
MPLSVPFFLFNSICLGQGKTLRKARKDAMEGVKSNRVIDIGMAMFGIFEWRTRVAYGVSYVQQIEINLVEGKDVAIQNPMSILSASIISDNNQ